MTSFFYRFLMLLSKYLGPAPFILLASIVAGGYFLLLPGRVAASVRFYRTLFPDKPAWYHILSAWKQYHRFTYVFLDRFMLYEFGNISYTAQGWEYLEDAVGNKTGGIILMSHIGNWEIPAYLMKQKAKDVPMLFYMGIRRKEEVERIQKDDISKSGIRIIAVDKDGGSPMDIIEGIKFLKNGGIVSMTGDILWKESHRSVTVRFLNRDVLLPEIPHVLALLSGAPLFIFFSFRTGMKQYAFSITPPIYVRAFSRSSRNTAIRRSAQNYADLLEQTLREHPWDWYHFEPFLK